MHYIVRPRRYYPRSRPQHGALILSLVLLSILFFLLTYIIDRLWEVDGELHQEEICPVRRYRRA